MSDHSREAVLLLHGAWMNPLVMSYLAHALRREGFAAHTLGYRTIAEPLESHLSRVANRVARLNASGIHLVGHSLGGVIVMRYLQRMVDARVRRAVLLGAPVAGCRAAARFAERLGGELMMGQSLSVWREPVDVAVDSRFEIGAIGGTRAVGLARMMMRLPSPNDGVVCLDETKFPGLRDHLVLPVGHTLMLMSSRVASQIVSFLKTGAFRR
jgi:pimeloyl-ACP methyl ester carboxylesterase